MNVPSAPRQLDRFESALLEELRGHVAARATTGPAPTPVRRPRRSLRWATGAAVAAVAAGGFVIGSPGGPSASPAFAVVEEPDGDVVVTIHRLEDPQALEDALADHGIEAHVDYRPDQFSVELEDPGDDGVIAYSLESPEDASPLPGFGICGDPAEVFDFRRTDDAWMLTIPAGSVLLDDSVLRLTTSSTPEDQLGALLATYVVDGAECGFAIADWSR